MKELTDEAKNVVNDYEDKPSEISGSIVEIHSEIICQNY